MNDDKAKHKILPSKFGLVKSLTKVRPEVNKTRRRS
jgi:hypothetical protein